MEPVENKNTQVSEVERQQHVVDRGIKAPVEKKAAPADPGEKEVSAKKAPNDAEIETIAESVNNYLKENETDLQVEIHKDSNTPIFKIVRKEDDEVIREIPPREMLEMASKIRDMVGVLVDANA